MLPARSFSIGEAVSFGWNAFTSRVSFFIVAMILAAVAYLLQENGYKPGQDLPTDEAMLNGIGFGG